MLQDGFSRAIFCHATFPMHRLNTTQPRASWQPWDSGLAPSNAPCQTCLIRRLFFLIALLLVGPFRVSVNYSSVWMYPVKKNKQKKPTLISNNPPAAQPLSWCKVGIKSCQRCKSGISSCLVKNGDKSTLMRVALPCGNGKEQSKKQKSL